MFKNVLLPIKFDCFVGWVVGAEVLTRGRGVPRRGNSWWGCAAGSLNSDPISDQKMKFFTPVFRPCLQGIMSSLLRLERQQKRFLQLCVEFAYFSFFLIHKTTNTFIHSLSFLENHSRFQTEVGKVYTHFQTETAQKPYPLQRHLPYWHIQGIPTGVLNYLRTFVLEGKHNIL